MSTDSVTNQPKSSTQQPVDQLLPPPFTRQLSLNVAAALLTEEQAKAANQRIAGKGVTKLSKEDFEELVEDLRSSLLDSPLAPNFKAKKTEDDLKLQSKEKPEEVEGEFFLEVSDDNGDENQTLETSE